MSLLLSLLGLSVIIIAHEFGHYSIARLFNIKVFEFSIGFGKVLFQKKLTNTTLSIRLLPFGGYVKLAGMDKPENETESVSDDESFSHKPFWQKQLVLFAGSFFNMILAVVVLFMINWVIGIPGGYSSRVESVLSGSAATQIGIKSGDLITLVNGIAVADGESLVSLVQKYGKNTLTLTYARGTDVFDESLLAQHDEVSGRDMLGVRLERNALKRYPLIPSIVVSIRDLSDIFSKIMISLGQLFQGRVSMDQLAGPIGIMSISSEMASYGMVYLLQFIVLLSVNLAIINLFPFPALDGGRMFLLTIEKLIGKQLKPEVEVLIHNIGFLLLISLLAYITYFDFHRLLVK